MFGTILISVCTIIHVYIFWRIRSMPMITGWLSGGRIAAVGIGLWAILVLSRYYGHFHAGKAAYFLELFGMTWLGFLFLIFVSLLASEIITGFGFLFSGIAPKIREAALITGIILALIALVQGNRLPVIETYEAAIPGLPDHLEGKVIVAVADIHIGSLRGGDWLKACVKKIQDQKPDILLLVGDIVEGHGRRDQSDIKLLSRLSAPMGAYAVLGNHEFHGDGKDITRQIEANGIKVLRNRWVELQDGLILAGVDDFRSYARSINAKTDLLRKALENRPEGPTILLSHRPDQVEKAAAFGVDLMLSGHTHGGQIWPFGYITRQFFPFLQGEYRVKEMTLIVCRGTGTWGPHMRLWSPGEISHITLRKK